MIDNIASVITFYKKEMILPCVPDGMGRIGIHGQNILDNENHKEALKWVK